jgi:hypothetical protein
MLEVIPLWENKAINRLLPDQKGKQKNTPNSFVFGIEYSFMFGIDYWSLPASKKIQSMRLIKTRKSLLRAITSCLLGLSLPLSCFYLLRVHKNFITTNSKPLIWSLNDIDLQYEKIFYVSDICIFHLTTYVITS